MRASLTSRLEMTIALPLDVLVGKLRRIEEELRHLSIKALSIEQEGESEELKTLIAGRLERLRDTIYSISSCVSDLRIDMQSAENIPVALSAARRMEKFPGEEAADAPFERENSDRASRKPRPDQDD